MAYKDVVREMFAKHKGKAPKEIMRLAAREWTKIKGGKRVKGAGVSAGNVSPDDDMSGSGLFGDLGHGIDSVASLIGLGLKKPKKGRKMRGGDVSADDVSAGDLMDYFTTQGFGLKKPKKAMKKRGGDVSAAGLMDFFNRHGGDVSADDAAAGNLADFFTTQGFGLKKPKKAMKKRGGGVSAGDITGSGLFGGIGQGIDSIAHLIGLGLDAPTSGGILQQPRYASKVKPHKVMPQNVGETRLYNSSSNPIPSFLDPFGRSSGSLIKYKNNGVRGGNLDDVSGDGVSGGDLSNILGLLPMLALL
jgi:hypothetical protein